MSQRKLQALQHPNPNSLNIEDDGEFRQTIVWLEDQKIRHYKIEDRASLRNIGDSDKWTKAFNQYLDELQCPYKAQSDQRAEIVDWLLGLAVRLEYGDNLDKYKSKVEDTAASNKLSTTSNPLESIDFNSPDAKAGITSLAQLLHIPPHPDHIEVLKAICILVKEKLSPDALSQAKEKIEQSKFLTLENIQLGFDSGDYISNDAAKILRLLHIHNLRELQTQINAAIVAVQAITANPKTDTKLGKVGR